MDSSNRERPSRPWQASQLSQPFQVSPPVNVPRLCRNKLSQSSVKGLLGLGRLLSSLSLFRFLHRCMLNDCAETNCLKQASKAFSVLAGFSAVSAFSGFSIAALISTTVQKHMDSSNRERPSRPWQASQLSQPFQVSVSLRIDSNDCAETHGLKQPGKAFSALAGFSAVSAFSGFSTGACSTTVQKQIVSIKRQRPSRPWQASQQSQPFQVSPPVHVERLCRNKLSQSSVKGLLGLGRLLSCLSLFRFLHRCMLNDCAETYCLKQASKAFSALAGFSAVSAFSGFSIAAY